MPQLPLPVQSRVPCISLNAFAFPVKDTVVEKIFKALGGQSLLKSGAKYAHSSFNSLSMFFHGDNTRANYVCVICHNNICTVDFHRFDFNRCAHLEVVQRCENVPFQNLPALFSDVTGLQFNQN